LQIREGLVFCWDVEILLAPYLKTVFDFSHFMSKIDYLQPVSKTVQLVAGLFAAAVGSVLLFLGGVLLYILRTDAKAPAGMFLAGVVLLVVGCYCTVLSLRLMFLRPRKRDGGLLSPFALRVAAVCFIALPLSLFMLLPGLNVHLLLHFGILVACSAACWRLAIYRRSVLQARESVPFNQ
jgi:hypothetical protein